MATPTPPHLQFLGVGHRRNRAEHRYARESRLRGARRRGGSAGGGAGSTPRPIVAAAGGALDERNRARDLHEQGNVDTIVLIHVERMLRLRCEQDHGRACGVKHIVNVRTERRAFPRLLAAERAQCAARFDGEFRDSPRTLDR